MSDTLQKTVLAVGKGKRLRFALEQSERWTDSYAKRRYEARGLSFVPLTMGAFVGERTSQESDIRECGDTFADF